MSRLLDHKEYRWDQHHHGCKTNQVQASHIVDTICVNVCAFRGAVDIWESDDGR